MAELSLLFTVPYERRSAEQKDRITALMSRRKRNKKRKKKLPKTSSSCGRARRRQRQWHARDAGFPGDVSPRAVFPLVADRPRCSTSWPVWNRRTVTCSSMLLLALWFLPCLQARDARHHGRFGPKGFWHVQGLVCWYFDDVFRAVLLLVVSSPRCLHRYSSWTRLSCPLCARQMP